LLVLHGVSTFCTKKPFYKIVSTLYRPPLFNLNFKRRTTSMSLFFFSFSFLHRAVIPLKWKTGQFPHPQLPWELVSRWTLFRLGKQDLKVEMVFLFFFSVFVCTIEFTRDPPTRQETVPNFIYKSKSIVGVLSSDSMFTKCNST
jgi:hypothetical protein